MRYLSRKLLIGVTAALALWAITASLPERAVAAALTAGDEPRPARADLPRIVPIADGVYVYQARHPEADISTNSLIVVTTDGVLVVDGQATVDATRELVAEIRKLSDKGIKRVVVASPHPEHTGGNAAFPTGAVFVARAAAEPEVRKSIAPRFGTPPDINVDTTTIGVGERYPLRMGDTEIQLLNLGRTRTGNDLAVWLPAQRVLFLSDTYLHQIFPFASGAFPTEWVEAVRKAEGIDAAWYVPGHGTVDDAGTLKEGLTTYRRALEKVRAEGSRLYRAGVPIEGAAAKADFGEFTDWPLRERNAPLALRRVYDALSGR